MNPEKQIVVLVVDDEDMDSTLVRRTLERAGGFLVLEERSFEAAVRRFEEQRGSVDLVIVDVSLPGQNGVDLAKRLLRQRPELKVLFVSGWVGAELLRARQIPESDKHFLAKPFRPVDLLDRVRSVLADASKPAWLAGDAGEEGSQATSA